MKSVVLSTTLILSLAIIAWLPPQLPAATYYVKNGGNDRSSGRSDNEAWATITKVNSYGQRPGFRDGDVVCFKRGDLFDDATLGFTTKVVRWGKVNGLTFRDYGSGPKPQFDGNTFVPIHFYTRNQQLKNLTIQNIQCHGSGAIPFKGFAQLFFYGIEGLTISGVEADMFRGAVRNAREGIKLLHVTGKITIKDCRLSNFGPPQELQLIAKGGNKTKTTDYIGIHIRNSDKAGEPVTLLIHDNKVFNTNSDCLQIAGLQPTAGRRAIKIYNNLFYNFGENAIDVKQCDDVDIYQNDMFRGTWGLGGSGGGKGTVVVHNYTKFADATCDRIRIYDNYIHTTRYIGLRLIAIDGTAIEVFRNRIKNCGTGISLGYGRGVKIYNNLFQFNENKLNYDAKFTNRSGIRITKNAKSDANIYNNTIYISDDFHLYGIAWDGSEENRTGAIKNNLLYIKSSSAKAYPLYAKDAKPGQLTVSHNSYFNPRHRNRIMWNGHTYSSTKLNAWRKASHPGALFGDPGLSDPNREAFWPIGAKAAVVNTGQRIPTSAAGLEKTTAWPRKVRTVSRDAFKGHDIGAYEYTN